MKKVIIIGCPGSGKTTFAEKLNQITVFLFDLPTEVCIQGAIDRLGKDRYDLPWIEKELSPSFKQTIEEFQHNSLPKIYGLIEKYSIDKQVIIFRSRKDVDDYLKSIS